MRTQNAKKTTLHVDDEAILEAYQTLSPDDFQSRAASIGRDRGVPVEEVEARAKFLVSTISTWCCKLDQFGTYQLINYDERLTLILFRLRPVILCSINDGEGRKAVFQRPTELAKLIIPRGRRGRLLGINRQEQQASCRMRPLLMSLPPALPRQKKNLPC
mmetsp:Transcript_39335/g.80640  ORF Transcript_39335/g.80640 Transcript_39335/m.80640 type:complete len:160 (+) Transcript_39335:1145-1624(+)